MFKLLFYGLLLVAVPVSAFALGSQVDFTAGIMEHAGLILALMFTLGPGVAFYGKMLLDKNQKAIDDKTKRIEEQEDKAFKAELDSKEVEIKALKERVDKFEAEHNLCNRSLPVNYVTRAEYDKFTEQHRVDIGGITNRLENMIRDLRIEIRNDMQDNINRIIDLLKEMNK
jgi:hypothetical protein